MPCGKTYLYSKKHAKKILKKRKSGGLKIKLRIYKCDKCSAWHFTSMPAWAISKLKDNRSN